MYVKREQILNYTKLYVFVDPFNQHNIYIYITDTGWIENKDRQLFVYNVNVTFDKAFAFCKKLGAAIVSFTNPSAYILLARNITLNGKYWVGGTNPFSF